jgi:large subunit ribosomal protein L24
MNKIRKGDEIVVTAGKDKGRRGTVLQLFSDTVLVEGINVAKKHQKGNPNQGIEGGIIEKEMPIAISNVLVFNAKTKKGERVGIQVAEDGSKERVFRQSGEVVDI